ncbi:MAG: V-type ATP synthase subunit D [Gammaproteobacteria bacterium]
MAKLKLSKQSLHHQQEQLKLYKRLLPSLDLKRRQLTLETQKAQDEYAAALAALEALVTRIGTELPMLADEQLRLQSLVVVKEYRCGEQNVVGVKLPVLEAVDYQVAKYAFLDTPPWIDLLIQRLKDAKTCRLHADIAAERVEILRLQVRRVTQRVNLFEKILIPTAQKNIQRIRIYLGETERSAVVTSKLAKAKQLQQRSVLMEEAL